MSNIIFLVDFQVAFQRRIVCIDCSCQTLEYIAEKIKPENIKCSGCDKTGFIIWWGDNDYKYD